MSFYKCNCGNPAPFGGVLNACGWNYTPSPYYNGPCPTAGGEYRWEGEENAPEARRSRSACGCCPGERPNPGREERVRGSFTTPPLLNVIPGASIPLVPCGRPCDIDTMGGAVQIEKSGVYYATYTLTPPAGEALTTTLMPTLNGVMLPAGMVEVGGEVARAVSGFSGQIVFCANSCDRFALTTSEALSVPASGTPLLTMELTRIGE